MAVFSKLLVAAFTASSVAAASPQDEYDYVVVGSGPGGGSLAYVPLGLCYISKSIQFTQCRANLAASGNSVFLIEAGGDRSEDPLQVLPVLLVLKYRFVGPMAKWHDCMQFCSCC